MKKCYLAAVITGMTMLATPVFAATITTEASYDFAGITASQSGSQGFSSVDTWEGWEGAYSSSRANAAGELAVASSYETEGGGGSVPFNVTSTSTWTETFIAGATGSYSWDAEVPSVDLRILSTSGAGIYSDSLAAIVGEITVNGTLMGSYTASVDAGGVHTGGLMSSPSYLTSYSGAAWAGWEDMSFSIDLGSFNAGEQIVIGMSVSSMVSGLGGMDNVYASVGDPGSLYYTGSGAQFGTLTSSSAAPAPVPEPATMLLFGTGLVGLVGSRLKRKKRA